MDAILLRKMTKLSKFRFGKYQDYTLGHLLEMKKHKMLTSIYFKLSAITYTDDILDELGITEEFRIPKPSKDRELFEVFMFQKYGARKPLTKKLEKMRKGTKALTKGQLMSNNHGK